MAVFQPRQGSWISRGLLAAVSLLHVTAWLHADDAWVRVSQPIVRGQSPFGSASLPPEPSSPFGGAAPWISAAPKVAQGSPVDPFGQPVYDGAPSFGGMPYAGDPALGGVFADEPAVWQPYVAMQGNFGNKNNVGIGQLMMPLYQDGQSLIFADIRGRFDDSSNTEGNFGLAIRKLIAPDLFVGAYGFYDYRHTSYGNNFSQGVLGIEAMTVEYEARLNGYIPETGAKQANSLSAAEFDGASNTIFVKGGFERAYYGIDGEIGALLWEEAAGNVEVRGFVGGYWFDTNGEGFPSVAGPKGRLELRLYDLPCIGPESRLTFGVEMRNDSVRDFQIAGIARLEIPLGFFNPTRKLTRIERRMLDRIVRDDDIITVARQGDPETGVDALTGRLLENVVVTNATDDPDLATAATDAYTLFGADSIVVVDGSQGSYTIDGAAGHTVVLQQGQVLRGGGFAILGGSSGAQTTFGTRPTIDNSTITDDSIQLADDTTVADLTLTGGLNGISSLGALSNVLVSGNHVSGAFNSGYKFGALDADSAIVNNTAASNGRDSTGTTIAGSTGHGFHFSDAFAGTAQGNTATNNTGIGFLFDSDISGDVLGNTASLNGLDDAGAVGTAFEGFFVGGSLSGSFSDNTATRNSGTGFSFGPIADGGTVTGNTATSNGRNADGTTSGASAFAHGFDFDGAVSGLAVITGNTAASSAQDGFCFGDALDGTVSSNTATGSGGFGFRFEQNIAGTVSQNSATNNNGGGFFFNMIGAAGSVTNNTATANGFVNGVAVNATAIGFAFDPAGSNAGDFLSNTAWANSSHGFSNDDGTRINNTGVFSSNIALQNSGDGFVVANTGTFENNQSNSNLGAGYDVTGAGTGNTGAGNGSDDTP